ncbi:hypothetical protein MTO96_006886 [Rhipicephalus appendiculatus]
MIFRDEEQEQPERGLTATPPAFAQPPDCAASRPFPLAAPSIMPLGKIAPLETPRPRQLEQIFRGPPTLENFSRLYVIAF